MTDKSHRLPDEEPKLPRVTADFGGRRKIYMRRLKKTRISHKERRSGFDRRSAQNQDECDDSFKRDVAKN